MVRAIVLTSTFLRHRFVVNCLAEDIDVVGVWQIEKSFEPMSYAKSDDDNIVIKNHFAARDESEIEFFNEHKKLKLGHSCIKRVFKRDGINDPKEISDMISISPDVVLVFGTGLLREKIISAFDGNIINIHLGLSPYYRGSGTNFWPLVNREPEYVGATIHYLDKGIDTGAIICHVRPKMEVTDGPHEIGNKTIIEAAIALRKAARAHVEGKVFTVDQTGEGKLYQRKDFNADAVGRLYKNFKDGMIEEYLSNAEERDSKLNIVSQDYEK